MWLHPICMLTLRLQICHLPGADKKSIAGADSPHNIAYDVILNTLVAPYSVHHHHQTPGIC